MNLPPFEPFPKISRLSRDCVITEKIDGTNAQIFITDEDLIFAGSRNRWLSPGKSDNFGFAAWVEANREELFKLGPGRHFGEWWGSGIQRTYGMKDKRFSLFNTNRWGDPLTRPYCCGAVPVLYSGDFNTSTIENVLRDLRERGSRAAPGFMNPEGIVVFHAASSTLYKKTLRGDEKPKGAV